GGVARVARCRAHGSERRGGAVADRDLWPEHRGCGQAVAALAAIPRPVPQSARDHPARGERAVGRDRRHCELCDRGRHPHDQHDSRLRAGSPRPECGRGLAPLGRGAGDSPARRREAVAADLVPADSRLLESRDLFVNQSLLTGESYPAEKLAGDLATGADDPAGASNAVFAGTSVISGTATILVCRTGAQTALGDLATSLAEKPPATAFEVGIRRFGMLIMRFTVLMVLFVLVVNISFHRP